MDAQLLCKFCKQPIFETEQTSGYMGRPIWMRGRWLHVREEAWACVPTLIDPSCEKPRCHICGTEDEEHAAICSAAGAPPAHAMPVDYPQTKPFRPAVVLGS
jgi:hypothetical protein